MDLNMLETFRDTALFLSIRTLVARNLNEFFCRRCRCLCSALEKEHGVGGSMFDLKLS